MQQQQRCPSARKILNPASGRMVLACGKIGQALLASTQEHKEQEQPVQWIIQQFDQVHHPLSKQQKACLRALLYKDCFSGELQSSSDVELNLEYGWAIIDANNPLHFFAFLSYEGQWIWNVCTATNARGKGLMRKLMHAFLEDWMTRFPRRSILRLNVWASNEPAIHLYESFGFVKERLQMIDNPVVGSKQPMWLMSWKRTTA